MMKEILITSSVLILALLVLRQAFRGVLSRRFQYALWALVLARLLVPVNLLPAADFSVLTATRPVQNAVAERISPDRIFYSQPRGQVSREELEKQNIDPQDIPTPQDLFVMGESDPNNRFSTNWLVRDPETDTVTRYAEMTVGPWDLLDRVWKAGMALMGGFFLLSNLGFYWRLRKNRREWRDEVITPYGTPTTVGPDDPSGRSPRKIYLVPDGVIPSPCLFGRSIYITPAVAEDEHKLRHVLCHEETHARHWDPVWSLLRCVCLTVYWFDPLVWAAAACSRTDCELACDESVLKALGEDERIPYGQTLVSLIPVRRVGNPMIAATTMTAGKKQLRDRVTRIAQKPRQLLAAALAVAVLAGIISACTFTGSKGEPTLEPSPSQGPTESTLRSLTGEELRWFNEEFFNNFNSVISYTYNIRNQFINSAFNLYNKPEDIDLYQLFYCDGSILSDAEYRAAYGEEEMNCPAFKLTAEELDNILREYTGLTLAQTNLVGLDNFTYQDGAYYWMHGDTNYPGDIEILYGTREGDTVKLYHHGWSSGSEWYCTTLEDRAGQVSGPYEGQGESRYWFVSNQECEKPAIPTPLPAWEPEFTVSLRDLKPYTAPAVTVEPHVGDFDNSYENRLENWDFDGHNVVIYRSTAGRIYAAIRRENGTMDVFLTLPSDDCSLFFYNNLLGHSGFYIKYVGGVPGDYYKGGEGGGYGTVYDYFYMSDDGVPVRLLRNPSSGSAQIDLNGDGQDELLGGGGFFFLRDGLLYQAAVSDLEPYLPGHIENVSMDQYGKYFLYRGYTEVYKEWTRYLYFDGEALLIYKNEKPAHDHMVDGADEGVPAIVVEKARQAAEAVYTGVRSSDEPLPEFDDWQITGFYGPYVKTLGGVTLQGWHFAFAGHTTTPERVTLAGENFLTEDNWTGLGAWGESNIIFLRQEEDGSLSYLWTDFDDGTLESYSGTEGLLRRMEELGVELTDGSTYGQLLFQMRLGHVTGTYYGYSDADLEMRIQYDDGRGNGGAHIIDPQQGNGPYFLGQMKDNSVVWSRAQAPAATPAGATVILSDPYWYDMLQFWKDSGLVMYKQENMEPEWYEVRYDGDPAQDVFSYRAVPYYWARCWFDDAQHGALEGELPLIPDSGQSYLNIAQEWAGAHEGVKTRLLPGGSTTCSYMKVSDVEILEDQPETWFPADIVDYPHFAFSYRVAFVPENQDALYTLMAGNTGEYEGNDPDVPQGAYEYSRRGSMYLRDGHWYCAGVGTG